MVAIAVSAVSVLQSTCQASAMACQGVYPLPHHARRTPTAQGTRSSGHVYHVSVHVCVLRWCGLSAAPCISLMASPTHAHIHMQHACLCRHHSTRTLDSTEGDDSQAAALVTTYRHNGAARGNRRQAERHLCRWSCSTLPSWRPCPKASSSAEPHVHPALSA